VPSTQQGSDNLDRLADHEATVYSQCGEDGVLQCIYEVIGTRSRYFVEFGAWDGQHLSNTANLRLHHGWSGLLMEGSDRADGRLVQHEFVNAENVNALFAKYDVPKIFDLLSIDIDGNDYWVWKAIEDYTPRVVVMEYNIFFGLHHSRTIRYDADHVWDETLYHGASLLALRKLGHEKGYRLVHADGWAPNAFFVLASELPADFEEPPIERVTPWNTFVEMPPVEGREWVRV
jgi:hypothetical protein